MATEIILSGVERTARLNEMARQFLIMAQQASSIERLAAARLTEGDDPVTIETDIQALLTALGTSVTALIAEAELVGYTHQSVVQPGCPHAHSGVIVIHDTQGGVDALVSDAKSWDGLYTVGDVILLSNAEDAANNKAVTVVTIPIGDITTDYIANGDFSALTGPAPDDWTCDGTGWGTEWTADGTKITHVTGNTAMVSQSVTGPDELSNTRVACYFTVSGITAGQSVAVSVGSTSYTISADGDYIVLADPSTLTAVSFVPSSAFVGDISAVSLFGFGGITVSEDLTANALDTRMKLTLSERTTA